MTKDCAQCGRRIARDTKICPHCGTHSPHKLIRGQLLDGLLLLP
jgi:RNA polymerase subunit RPABC4/transcription elongation factor Spt4